MGVEMLDSLPLRGEERGKKVTFFFRSVQF